MNSIVPFQNKNMVLAEPVEHIELYEVNALLRACDLAYENSPKTEYYTWLRDRDKLLIQMLWITGARISDVLSIETNRINYKEHSVTFLVHKRRSRKATFGGEFWHTISLDIRTISEIIEYTQTWSIKGYLFTANKEKQKLLTRQAINKKLNELTDLVNMRHIHPHMFRHGLAMHMQAQGVPAEVIAYRLAHSSTAITLQTYARMNLTQEKSILESLNVQFR